VAAFTGAESQKQNTEIADIMRCGNVFSYWLKYVFSMNFSTWVKNDSLRAFYGHIPGRSIANPSTHQ